MSLRNRLARAASLVRIAKNEVQFLTRCDLMDTDFMREAQQELRVAQAVAAVVRRQVINAMANPECYLDDAKPKQNSLNETSFSASSLEVINIAAEVGFSLSV